MCERCEEARFLLGLGESAWQVARALGMSVPGLEQHLRRHGQPEARVLQQAATVDRFGRW